MKDLPLGWSETGLYSQMHLGDTDECYISHTQPGSMLDQILDENHDAREAGRNPVANSRLVASVPQSVYLQWRQEWLEVRNSESEVAFYLRKLAEHNFSKLRIHGSREDLLHLARR